MLHLLSSALEIASRYCDAKSVSWRGQQRVTRFNLLREHMLAEVDPQSGHVVLNFPMKQMGHLQTLGEDSTSPADYV